MTPVHLLTQAEALLALVEHLQDEPILGMDTESNNLYAYQEQVCLIQISSRQTDYLLDPLSLTDLSPLNHLTANPQIEKVFHAADHDISCLKRDFGLEFANIFDTMYSARMLGVNRAGLVHVVRDYFGVELDKSWQRADWGQRPLSDEQLEYARLDTRFLPALRDIFRQQLAEAGLLEEALDIFDELAQTPPQINQFNPDDFWRIHGVERLKPRQLACLRELYIWREETARTQDIPVMQLLSNEELLLLARKNPRTMGQLHQTRILRGWMMRAYGRGIIKSLERGRRAPPPRRPVVVFRDPAINQLLDRLLEWRKARASARGVDSDLILSRETLWEIAQVAPRTLEDLYQIPALGPWRIQHYGPEILQILAEVT